MIDGNVADIQNFSLGDNLLSFTADGESIVINGINLFDLNTESAEGAFSDENTSIVFEDGFIIDNLADTLGLIETAAGPDTGDTAAGEESTQSQAYFRKFDERNGAEVDVESTLRGSPISSKTELREIERERVLYENGDDLYKKEDPLTKQGGLPKNIPESYGNAREDDEFTNTGGEYVELTDSEAVSQNVPEAQEEEIIPTNEETEIITELVESDRIPTNEEQEIITEPEEEQESNTSLEPEEEQEIITEPEEEQEIITEPEEEQESNTEPEEENLDNTTEYEDSSNDNNTSDIVDSQDGDEDEDEAEEDSNDSEIDVIITPINEAPEIITANILTIDEDNIITFTKDDLLQNVTDANENDIIEIGNVTSNIGTITENNGIYTIEVPENYNGTIELSMTATDGTVEVPGKAMITVTPVDDVPEVNFINPTVLEDESIIIPLNVQDVDSENVQVEIFQGPNNGTATINDEGNLEYTPVENYNGSQEVILKLTDGTNIVYETVNIEVSPVNDEPEISVTNSITIDEDSEANISFDITDVDGDIIDFDVKGGENGTIVVDGTQIFYVPNENYSGADTIQIDYTDGTVNKSHTLNVNVKEVNDEPTIEITNEIVMVEDQIQEILFTTSDVEGGVEVSVSAENGNAIIDEDGMIIYAPNDNYNGSDNITITVIDEAGAEVTKNISVQIDNDNTDFTYEIITETVTETHTEIVTHTELRDVEVTEVIQVPVEKTRIVQEEFINTGTKTETYVKDVVTEETREVRTEVDPYETVTETKEREVEVQKERIVEVIDEKANQESGIYQNEDGEWVTKETQNEVYYETIDEEKTREIKVPVGSNEIIYKEETFTNYRTEVQQQEITKFQDKQILNNGSKKNLTIEVNGDITFTASLKGNKNTAGEIEIVKSDGNIEIVNLNDGMNSFRDVKIITLSHTGANNNGSIHLDGIKTTTFQDIEVQIPFEDTKITNEIDTEAMEAAGFTMSSDSGSIVWSKTIKETYTEPVQVEMTRGVTVEVLSEPIMKNIIETYTEIETETYEEQTQVINENLYDIEEDGKFYTIEEETYEVITPTEFEREVEFEFTDIKDVEEIYTEMEEQLVTSVEQQEVEIQEEIQVTETHDENLLFVFGEDNFKLDFDTIEKIEIQEGINIDKVSLNNVDMSDMLIVDDDRIGELLGELPEAEGSSLEGNIESSASNKEISPDFSISFSNEMHELINEVMNNEIQTDL